MFLSKVICSPSFPIPADPRGRLLIVYKNIDNAGADQLITTNTYNELGQLNNKAEGNSIESLAYLYNIRGWLSKAIADITSQLDEYRLKQLDKQETRKECRFRTMFVDPSFRNVGPPQLNFKENIIPGC